MSSGTPSEHWLRDQMLQKVFPIALLLGLIGAVVGTWLWYFPYASVNYKLAIDIDDNGTLRHSEGVIGVTLNSNGFMRTSETPLWAVGVRGEALAVDLGEHGTLFVLLTRDGARKESAEAGRGAMWRYFKDNFGDLPPNYDGKRKLDKFAQRRAIVEIVPDSLPMLVRFRDLNDPKSVEKIDPDHLDESFGQGVRLLRATAQLTDEPVTTGIRSKLGPWYDELKTLRATLDGDTSIARFTDAPLANKIGTGSFQQGMEP